MEIPERNKREVITEDSFLKFQVWREERKENGIFSKNAPKVLPVEDRLRRNESISSMQYKQKLYSKEQKLWGREQGEMPGRKPVNTP